MFKVVLAFSAFSLLVVDAAYVGASVPDDPSGQIVLVPGVPGVPLPQAMESSDPLPHMAPPGVQ